MTDYIQVFADTLGVSSSVIGIILFLVLALLASTAVMVFTGSTKLGLLAPIGPILLGASTGFLPLWIAVVTVLMGMMAFGYHTFFRDGGGGVALGPHITRSPETLALRIEKSSSSLSQYINNLDDLLGIRTCNRTQPRNGKALRLTDRKVLLISQDYDWYLTAKHSDQDVFKVVGIHKEDDAKNKVYLLGKNEDSGVPFLTPISSVYLEGDLEECAIWAKRKGLVTLASNRDYTSISAVASILPVVFVAVILVGAVGWLSGKS